MTTYEKRVLFYLYRAIILSDGIQMIIGVVESLYLTYLGTYLGKLFDDKERRVQICLSTYRLVRNVEIGDILCAVANSYQSAALARGMRDTRKDCQLFSNSYGLISSLLKSYDSMLLTSAKLTTYTTLRCLPHLGTYKTLLVNTSYRCPDLHEIFRVGQP
ncbi:uncharacterized protein FPRO_06332 [Fusarium proliferatum ET1]|uniref:Uncharacterized protein n=1 Tax=Fusarium proliferatum (strain ET1) TaxID=1227346 RepID=A0A1L7VCQ2_FUSPR|nr:uncharacterized protein FPRO_06332 [Fusarium proliferatum ET1]CZR38477.1 uncharacterized protein FPRO_06332 [Fusarium proliferatum ET1]